MDINSTSNGEFLKELREIVRNNLTIPEFGVSMLAREVGMSRSNLHRKVNTLAKISVSQFIRQERLKAGLKLLKRTSFNVSEVTYKVGFNNVSYFIKCFHDYYGFSPGEVGKREQEVADAQTEIKRKRKPVYLVGLIVVLALVISFLVYSNSKGKKNGRKSIAVLPPSIENLEPENQSKINSVGIQLYSKLSLIKELDVRPYTSAAQYKNQEKSATKIAKELNVDYIVESRPAINNNNIQILVSLASASEDKIIWSHLFEENLDNVIELSKEISKELVEKLNIQITPAEKQRINKVLTTNKQAEIYYLQGNELFNRGRIWSGNVDQLNAIPWYEKAIENDSEFAEAYAELSIIYHNLYFYSFGNRNENHKNNFLKYAVLANLYAPSLDNSQLANALLFKTLGDYKSTNISLKKVLEYNPNSSLAYILLSDITTLQHATNLESVEYALKALDYGSNDNSEMSWLHNRAAYDLRSAGLYKEALIHINAAIKLDPDEKNNYLEKCEILILKDQNVAFAIKLLTELIQKYPDYNTGKYFLFKNYYWNGDYQNAYTSFKKFHELDDNGKFMENEYPSFRNLQRFVVILDRLGYKNEYDLYKKILMENGHHSFRTGAYYKSFELIRSYCITKEPEKLMQELRKFSKHDYFLSNHIYVLEHSPFYDIINGKSEYLEILAEIKTKFEINRDQIRASMVAKGLM